MTTTGYLRFPHIHDDLICFVAEDDVWLAPADGGRAWRLSADNAGASHPRFSPDGSQVAWTGRRDGQPEVYVADHDGGAGRRLTYWGNRSTRTCGWTPEGEVLAITAAGQGQSDHSWAHAVPVSERPARRLAFGPVADLEIRSHAVALLNGQGGASPRSGNVTGVVPPGVSGPACPAMTRARSASPESRQTCGPSSRARCWSATGSRSYPTTRARETCTRADWTALTCAATATMTGSTPVTPAATRPRDLPVRG